MFFLELTPILGKVRPPRAMAQAGMAGLMG